MRQLQNYPRRFSASEPFAKSFAPRSRRAGLRDHIDDAADHRGPVADRMASRLSCSLAGRRLRSSDLVKLDAAPPVRLSGNALVSAARPQLLLP